MYKLIYDQHDINRPENTKQTSWKIIGRIDAKTEIVGERERKTGIDMRWGQRSKKIIYKSILMYNTQTHTTKIDLNVNTTFIRLLFLKKYRTHTQPHSNIRRMNKSKQDKTIAKLKENSTYCLSCIEQKHFYVAIIYLIQHCDWHTDVKS